MGTADVVAITVVCLFAACGLLWLFTKLSKPPSSGIDWDKERRRPFRPRSPGSPLTPADMAINITIRTPDAESFKRDQRQMAKALLLVVFACLFLAGCGAAEEHDNLVETQRLDDERHKLEEAERSRHNEALARAALEQRELRKEISEARRGVSEVKDDMENYDE